MQTSCNQMISEEKFTRLFYDKLSLKVEGLELKELSELKITTIQEGEERHHFLNNAYANYKLDPDDLDEILLNFVKSSASIYEEAKPFEISKVVPIVKDKRYLQGLSDIRQGKPVEEVYESYNSELLIFYALDLEHSINYFNNSDLKKAGYTIDDLRKVALDNLYEIIEPINRNGDSQFYMIMCGGNYESSLILDENLWNKENFPVDGEIIIGVPSRDLVFVTGTGIKENIKKLEVSIKEVDSNEANLVSNKMFILRESKFEIYQE